jgi:hypothetical protein
MYISENETGYGKNSKKKMRLLLKKRFKDDESRDGRFGPDEEARPQVDDTDMKILDSDYSSSTFHLASRSSISGTGKVS